MDTACWVYMLRCRDGSLYTGWTMDLPKRVAAHGSGTGAKYTRGRGPVQLAFAQRCEGKSQALRREAEIKRLPKAKKEYLCNRFKDVLANGDMPSFWQDTLPQSE